MQITFTLTNEQAAKLADAFETLYGLSKDVTKAQFAKDCTIRFWKQSVIDAASKRTVIASKATVDADGVAMDGVQ
jgi:hypothetical protein